MAGVERFEDLVAWQRARELSKAIYALTRIGSLERDIGLTRQMQRAAVSVMANIAEGFERDRPNEFHQFLSIAKGSCAELRSHLYAAFDAGHLAQTDFDRFRSQAEEVTRIVAGLRAAVECRKGG